jgi:hypothetical protein
MIPMAFKFRRYGMTLIELSIASILFVMVGVMVAQALGMGLRNYRLQSDRLVDSRALSLFTTRLAADVATSRYGLSGTPALPSAFLAATAGAPLSMRKNTDTMTPNPIEYFYVPVKKQIVRRFNGADQVVLRPVEVFEYKVGDITNSIQVRLRMSSNPIPVIWEGPWVTIGW